MKTLTVTLFALSVALPVNAQLLRTYGFNVGYVKAEQSWTYSHSPSLGSGIKPIWGYDVGVFAEFFNDPNFSVFTEIAYIQKGRVLELQASFQTNNQQGYSDLGLIEIKQKFEYISIPLLAKLRLNGPMFTPFIAVGPSFEWLVSYPESDVYKKFNKMEIAAKLTAGVELSFTSIPNVVIECRYCPSLTNTYKNEFVTVQSRVLDLLLGVAF